jgi:tripeptide aminopeptidase
VVALRKGGGKGPKLVVSAHLDTVFPENTDVTVRETDGVLRAPGIGDDARGLAVLLSVIQTLNADAITTTGDVMLVGTVGEEELAICAGSRRCSATTATSTGSSRSTASASPAWSIARPEAFATR